MRVYEVMSDRVRTISPQAAAEEAWQSMQTKGIRHLVVVDGSTVVGVLSDSDAGGPSGWIIRSGATVGERMDRHVVSVHPNDTVRKAANLMVGHRIGCLPVMERDRLVGVVTVADLLTIIGRGVDRPSREARAAIHHRVPHRGSS